ATATPEVQRDIIVQLGVGDVRTYIHGFRRDNLAVEIAELRPSERGELTRQILMGEGRLPAIVYAPTRKQAEALAKDLGKRLRAAAYHAGMDAARRDRVQAQFLAGRLDAIVATIAFGMGIDKPDIRTVIHTALPSSVEGYYQEIGRAGRDGRPSRALLLHSYADRRTQEFFVQRDYPDPRELEDIYDLLSHRPRSLESLRRRLGVDRETLERRLEKLWIHGGARVEDEHALRGDPAWERSYTAQRAHKEGQLENMARFATGADCRMVQFIRHFGDQEDDGEPCGRCDICAPQGCLAKRTRATRDDERRQLDRIVAALREDGAVATGKLYRERFEGTLDRNEFEALLAALAQAGIVTLRDESFRKDGRTIAYRRVELSARGVRLAESDDDDDVEIHITESRTGGGKKKAARKRGAELSALEGDADPELVEALRDWRSERARRTKVPAYRILTNKALAAIAAARPKSLDALAVIHGVGPKVLERHGPDILKIVRGS
ncbi:MAG: ATP-dependent DNA helicase RecQ, partial [Myxococcales bacterium]|nr:ATP-dependent DNA helicase RecQ [Myxococcales bacterium]